MHKKTSALCPLLTGRTCTKHMEFPLLLSWVDSPVVKIDCAKKQFCRPVPPLQCYKLTVQHLKCTNSNVFPPNSILIFFYLLPPLCVFLSRLG